MTFNKSNFKEFVEKDITKNPKSIFQVRQKLQN